MLLYRSSLSSLVLLMLICGVCGKFCMCKFDGRLEDLPVICSLQIRFASRWLYSGSCLGSFGVQQAGVCSFVDNSKSKAPSRQLQVDMQNHHEQQFVSLIASRGG
ncbi:hypothetical protein M758_UG089500 [Ceratodon purpureus]|nr:hypothetical protein M758_UG089500 [Ceratodon purpureus]